MRSKEEVKLLQIRQSLRDAEKYLKSKTVVSLKLARELKLQFLVIEDLLLKIRKKEVKTTV